MKNDEEILKSLIAGGLIGGALGALLSEEKEDGFTLGAIAGAAILATFKANERAKLTKLPMHIEENGNLYIVSEDGTKKLVKKIEKPERELAKNFKLT